MDAARRSRLCAEASGRTASAIRFRPIRRWTIGWTSTPSPARRPVRGATAASASRARRGIRIWTSPCRSDSRSAVRATRSCARRPSTCSTGRTSARPRATSTRRTPSVRSRRRSARRPSARRGPESSCSSFSSDTKQRNGAERPTIWMTPEICGTSGNRGDREHRDGSTTETRRLRDRKNHRDDAVRPAKQAANRRCAAPRRRLSLRLCVSVVVSISVSSRRSVSDCTGRDAIMMMRRISVFLMFGLLLAGNASAQLASQTALVGTVTDQDGLVIPGAQVVAVNTGTRDTYETTTNGDGYYNIQFVRTGTYEITVALSGFQTSKVNGVEVANNQIARTNVVVRVGQLNESIVVAGSSPIIDTDSARLSETIGKRAVSDLPLNRRNVWNLPSTTPGVLGGLNSDIGLSFRGAGQREIQNSLSLDGINSSANLLAATSMRPITDAVEEIQIQTGSTSAEYGAYLGVHINVVTKSGTNTPHASLFEFFQDDALDQRGYFENPAVPKNPRRRNQFGFEMDGPVVLPKLYDGRNKTFITAAYEGIRANTLLTPIATVPTALMRQGNFSEITGTIRNPFTREPYPGNIIPA